MPISWEALAPAIPARLPDLSSTVTVATRWGPAAVDRVGGLARCSGSRMAVDVWRCRVRQDDFLTCTAHYYDVESAIWALARVRLPCLPEMCLLHVVPRSAVLLRAAAQSVDRVSFGEASAFFLQGHAGSIEAMLAVSALLLGTELPQARIDELGALRTAALAARRLTRNWAATSTPGDARSLRPH